ncbi:MAG TPA: hypothetical protein VKY54_00030 [Kiloniellales bacterium]|nr:hypothetical protein [Kiloniellales bacterium]
MTDCLRKILLEQARAGSLATYRQLAERLSLRPPGTIRRVAEALEILMTEDASAGRPLVAAFCVSRLGEGLPARGFFLKARDLGLFSGDPNGPEAAAFHATELRRARGYYGGSDGEVARS